MGLVQWFNSHRSVKVQSLDELAQKLPEKEIILDIISPEKVGDHHYISARYQGRETSGRNVYFVQRFVEVDPNFSVPLDPKTDSEMQDYLKYQLTTSRFYVTLARQLNDFQMNYPGFSFKTKNGVDATDYVNIFSRFSVHSISGVMDSTYPPFDLDDPKLPRN